MRSLNGAQLLILDDWGVGPPDAGARRDLYEILEERSRRRQPATDPTETERHRRISRPMTTAAA